MSANPPLAGTLPHGSNQPASVLSFAATFSTISQSTQLPPILDCTFILQDVASSFAKSRWKKPYPTWLLAQQLGYGVGLAGCLRAFLPAFLPATSILGATWAGWSGNEWPPIIANDPA
ncbi:hypothetical protein AB5N19_12087 [Seiridium cardinale]|uniref:Uncharacterized protein n=1 Tax=Seiridium cardinale TaxID=138064 RepID=A0ABR2XR12_9PEZI